MRMNERYELKGHGKVYTFFNKLLKNPYFLIAPAVIFDIWLTIFPMCFAVYMSFFKWDPISGRKKFLGLGNFRYLFQSVAVYVKISQQRNEFPVADFFNFGMGFGFQIDKFIYLRIDDVIQFNDFIDNLHTVGNAALHFIAVVCNALDTAHITL